MVTPAGFSWPNAGSFLDSQFQPRAQVLLSGTGTWEPSELLRFKCGQPVSQCNGIKGEGFGGRRVFWGPLWLPCIKVSAGLSTLCGVPPWESKGGCGSAFQSSLGFFIPDKYWHVGMVMPILQTGAEV